MQGLRGDRRTRFYIFSQGLTGWHLQGAALGWDGTKAESEASQGSPSSSASKPGSHLGGTHPLTVVSFVCQLSPLGGFHEHRGGTWP